MYNFLYVQLYKIFIPMAKKVLIIDDNTQDVKNTAAILEKEGMTCTQSNSTFDILNIIYSEVPDLIILDILMPEPGGYELCRMIKSDDSAKNIPVIMYSVLNKNIDKFWAYRSGADNYLNKGCTSDEFKDACLKIMEQMPVSLEVKAALLGLKSSKVLPPEANVSSKDDLIRDFNSIKELDGDANILAIKIFKVIYRYFKYSVAAICFKDARDFERLVFDVSENTLGLDVFESIKKRVNAPSAEIRVLLKKDEKNKINSIEDFSVQYEYEINSNADSIGYLCLYAKDNLTSHELKLAGTIKDLVEHIMRLRYFKICNKDNPKGANPRKLYTQLDFDRILSYEYGWHKRNQSPMCLAFMEIESLETVEKQYGGEYRDVLLAKVSNLLTKSLSDGDFIYRSEDDVFAILMTNSEQKRALETLEYLIVKIKDPISSSIDDEDMEIKIGALMLNDTYKNHYEYIDAIYDVLEEARHSEDEIVIR